MARLTDLPAAGALTGAEIIPLAQEREARQTTVADLRGGLAAAGHGHGVGDVSGLGSLATLNAVNNAHWSGTALAPGNGGTGTATAFTAGSVVFAGAGGVYAQNNGGLFWNNVNGRLGIGTGDPGVSLDIVGGSEPFVRVTNTGMPGSPNVSIGMNGGNNAALISCTAGKDFKCWNGQYALTILGNNGNVGVNSHTPAEKLTVAGNIAPSVDNAYTIGTSALRASAVWAATGAIQTSDARAKTDILNTPLGLDFILALRPVAYRFRVGGNTVTPIPGDEDGAVTVTPVPGSRQHFGLIAQEVRACLPPGVDFAGWVLSDRGDPDSQQGLRYDEFIAPLIRAVQDQQALIAALEARLMVLEGRS